MSAARPAAAGPVRAVVLVLAGLLFAAMALLATPAPAVAQSGAAGAFLADINAARAAAGLPAYSWASDLASVASSWSEHMANGGTLAHNPNLSTAVANWRDLGENVGRGPSESALHSAFMNSTAHRANILDRAFTQVGIGVAYDARGVMWVTQDFRNPMQAPPARTATSSSTAKASSTAKPSSSTAKASSSTAKPSSSTAKPSSSTAKPSSSTAKPSSSTAKPSSTPAPQPSATQPSTQPTAEPTAEPATLPAPQPVTEPTPATTASAGLAERVADVIAAAVPTGQDSPDPLAQTLDFAAAMARLTS